MTLRVSSYLAGRAVDSGRWIDRENPSRPDQIVGSVSELDAATTAEAIESAHAAFPDWAARSLEDRRELLLAATQAIMDEREELALLLTRELGKVITDTRGEIGFTDLFVSFCASVAEEVMRAQEIDDAGGRLAILREPYGVVGAITPWNAPVILTSLKVAPALLTGNTIVIKPSPLAPLAVTRLLGIMGAMLPPGVLNVVNGGADVGETLTTHRLVRKVAFTGGGPTARHIMASAAAGLKPLVLELGGNDPAIFLEDADLSPTSVGRAVFGSFLTAGQVCMAAKRLYVHESRADEFLSSYLEAAAGLLKVGDPELETTTVGPLVSMAQVQRVRGLVEDARSRGGVVHELGEVMDEELVRSGYFLRPTIVTGLADDAPLVSEEQFGPTVPLLTFADEDEVVARANNDDLGLASSVWSNDEEHAFDVARKLRCGYTFINSHNRSGLTLRAPFGGHRGSGFGREFGREGVAEYLQAHTVHLPAAMRGGGSGAQGNAYPGQ